MTLPAPLPDLPTGRYRHYKGGEYEVIAMAHHSETLEPMVIYKPLYNDTGWWVRPYAMFVETIMVAGTSQPRFTRIVDPNNLSSATEITKDTEQSAVFGHQRTSPNG